MLEPSGAFKTTIKPVGSTVQDDTPHETTSAMMLDWHSNKGGEFFMDLTVRQIWGLDVIEEDFKVQWVMWLFWRCDPKTQDRVQHLFGRHYQEWEPIPAETLAWIPKFRLMKETQHVIEKRTDFHAKKINATDIRRGWFPGAEPGEIWLKGCWKYTVAIAEYWHLKMFPFDTQDLNIMILIDDGVRLHPSSTVVFDPHGCELPDYGLGTGIWSPKWRLCERLDLNVPLGLAGVHLRMFYHRHYRYYVWNGLFIVGMVSFLTSMSWAINRTNTPDRLSLDITLLLVVVAFQQVIGQMVPAIAYLTLLDWYVIGNIGLMVLATAMHGMVGGFIDSCDPVTGDCEWYIQSVDMNSSLDWDRANFTVFASLWLLFHVCFSLWIWRRWCDPVACNKAFIDDVAKALSPEPFEWRDVLGNYREWNPPLPEHLIRGRSPEATRAVTKTSAAAW